MALGRARRRCDATTSAALRSRGGCGDRWHGVRSVSRADERTVETRLGVCDGRDEPIKRRVLWRGREPGRSRSDRLLRRPTPACDELVSRYGSRVDVRLGAFAYPDMNRRSSVDPGPDRPCPTIPTPGPSNASLKWSAAPRVLRIHSGGDMTVKVSFTNVRAKVVRYDSGEPIIGVISEAGTKRVVATYAGPIAGVGRTGTLRKGKGPPLDKARVYGEDQAFVARTHNAAPALPTARRRTPLRTSGTVRNAAFILRRTLSEEPLKRSSRRRAVTSRLDGRSRRDPMTCASSSAATTSPRTVERKPSSSFPRRSDSSSQRIHLLEECRRERS